MSMIPNFFGRRSNHFNLPGPFPLGPWDPLDGWPRPAFLIGPCFPPETASFARADVDWRETPTAHVFRAEVPGLKKEEVKVTVEDGGILHIRGERRRRKEEIGDGCYRMEQSSGSFSRRFRLPANAKVDQLKAAMEGGVLTVTVPKAEQPKRAHSRTIEISDM
ncbi:hypothetical protein L484_005860 [Morus notabilis]|uniref:SHSP domain-containing protein n=1 Tax=Morus notabilis TaxID=981085 RepID=W9SHQ0_9ROSA|nr:17.4 kDa class I heat shock protein [Morus notabilis]EXC07553.1 hypothetical protein L484_005860 [Morus notabilis]